MRKSRSRVNSGWDRLVYAWGVPKRRIVSASTLRGTCCNCSHNLRVLQYLFSFFIIFGLKTN